LKAQKSRDWKTGGDKGLVTPDEIAALEAADKAIAEVIAVDDFAHDGLATEVRAQARPGVVTPKRARAQSKGDDIQPPAVDVGESRSFGELS
jgi:acyl-CoA dehydrogenase